MLTDKLNKLYFDLLIKNYDMNLDAGDVNLKMLKVKTLLFVCAHILTSGSDQKQSDL